VESPHTLVHVQTAEPELPRRRIARRADELAREDLVLGRYRLLERLGAGGFGVVWSAHDELLHREVAVKRIWLGAGGGPIDSERASREALATARLSHPAIVALYEACAHEDAFYLISELVDGDTLARLIDEDTLADEEVLEIGLALVGGLSHAHARGVIHRDIKPQNVLVPRPPADSQPAPQTLLAAAKLTDFGGASLAGEDALTATGDVLGTLAYMAPEQSEGREVGVAADLYSLALVIYEALSGVNPVRGATPAATVRRIGRPLPPLARARRDLPSQLTRALDRALAGAPAQRGTLEELRVAFEQALARGLTRSRWRGGRAALPSRTAPEPAALEPALAAPSDGTAVAPRTLQPRRVAPAEHAGGLEPDAAEWASGPSHLALARSIWLVCAAALIAWQLFAGRPGVALLALAALAPLAVLPAEHGTRRVGLRYLGCALAPLLGLVGLAGAFPAIAGQASRWRVRAALAALACWWLQLAEPLLGRHLWLAEPARMPARAAWEGSLGVTAAHVIAPLLVLGVALGALLWAAAAVVLPWIVRGRSAVLDIVAVTVWCAALAAAAPALDAGLGGHAVHPDPRGLVLGAILGGLAAVAARALRGPV
jgi:eukaryotic-like serine/threonine-protein kinase